MREKVSIKNANSLLFSLILKGDIFLTKAILSFLLFIPFIGGKHNCLNANQGTNSEKNFNHIIYKGKDADFGGQ